MKRIHCKNGNRDSRTNFVGSVDCVDAHGERLSQGVVAKREFLSGTWPKAAQRSIKYCSEPKNCFSKFSFLF